MKTIYFVRHGQSEANASQTLQWADSPLSELGQQQAEQIAERVKNLPFETLVSSSYKRAQETALAISKETGKTPEYSDLLIERKKPTTLIGRGKNDTEGLEIHRQWTESLYTSGMRVDDGENFDDIVVRADAALAFFENRPEEVIVAVTHGFFLRVLVLRMLLEDKLTGELLKKFMHGTATENTGITVIKHNDSQWKLLTLNDHAHL